MEASVSQETAQAEVASRYRKLYTSLVELIHALNVLEPGGTLLDAVTFTTKEDGKVQITYVATPMQVTIHTPERRLIVRVIAQAGDLPSMH